MMMDATNNDKPTADDAPTTTTTTTTNNNNTGVLDLSFKNLNHKDLKRILTKLGASGRDDRPRKCRRLNELQLQIAQFSSSSSTTTKLWKLCFAGNTAIGDEGMKHLHLIPSSVCDLDFTDCNLTCEGIKTLCEFLERNKSITRMVLGGNGMNDEAAKAVGKMLSENDALQDLCINPRPCVVEDGTAAASSSGSNSPPDVTWIAAIKVCMGLYRNRTLRHLRFAVPNFSMTDEGIWYLMFAKMLHEDSPIETLECGNPSTTAAAAANVPTFLRPLLETVCDKWLEKLEKNKNIHTIGGSLLKLLKAENIQYYLDLNKCQARQIIRDPKVSSEEWLRSITCASEEHKLDAIYYLIRNKPEVCK